MIPASSIFFLINSRSSGVAQNLICSVLLRTGEALCTLTELTLLCPFGKIPGTLDDLGPETLLAAVYAPAAKTVVFSSAVVMDEERPIVLW